MHFLTCAGAFFWAFLYCLCAIERDGAFPSKWSVCSIAILFFLVFCHFDIVAVRCSESIEPVFNSEIQSCQ